MAEGGSSLYGRVLERYLALRQPADRVQVTYVWVDGSGENLRAKTRTLPREPRRPADCPVWNFDGSSTGQAETGNSDVYLHPVALFQDPFCPHTAAGVYNKLVLCQTLKPDGQPTASNKRAACAETMGRLAAEEPWFGLEQEFLLQGLDGRPFRWPGGGGFPAPQGPYYCSVGFQYAYGRPVVEAHYRACLFAGVSLGGTNAEVAPAQWEFQVGPCEGVDVGDQLWMARYILHRVAEDFGLIVTLHPKPVLGNWNGAGLHTNFSTKAMRGPGCLSIMQALLEKRLAPLHAQHLRLYDIGGTNAARLTGSHETSSPTRFTWGIADRAASVRIPRDVARAGAGYLEDRRPPANANPYTVAKALADTLL